MEEEQFGGGGMRRTLEDVLDGAFIGGGLMGGHALLSGANPEQMRRRLLQGMVFGAVGGGVMGPMVRGFLGGDAIDRMSYEELLERFGPGNVPQKAQEEVVVSLPETRLTEADIERMRNW
jgi:hypothetical protein